MRGWRGEPLDIDAVDGDWIKRGAWDIPAWSVGELRAWLDRQGMTVAEFKELEVYRAHVGDPDMGWLREL